MRPRENKDEAFLDDIREACALILSRTKNTRLPDFVSDTTLQDSVVLRLAVIGEASKNLTDAARRRYPNVRWRDMMRLRDLLVHRYWSVDPMKVWNIVKEDVPLLLETL